MDEIGILFFLAGLAIVVTIIHILLKQAGREEYAYLVLVLGITIALIKVILYVYLFYGFISTGRISVLSLLTGGDVLWNCDVCHCGFPDCCSFGSIFKKWPHASSCNVGFPGGGDSYFFKVDYRLW